MPVFRASALPGNALLRKYDDGYSFTDCYRTEVKGVIPFAVFVEAFYTTPLFRLERLILKWLARRPSTDEDARSLAQGTADTFAAWQVEARAENQLLMRAGRTRSWFMVEPVMQDDGSVATRLHFGSAVVAQAALPGGKPELGFLFRALLGFHRVYSRALLRAAAHRVTRRAN